MQLADINLIPPLFALIQKKRGVVGRAKKVEKTMVVV
jgi:hypothetical protein